MASWWYPLIAVAVFVLAAIGWLFLTRKSATINMPGGETIFDTPPRRE